MMVINGEYPGPLIEANEGDTIVVNVRNNLKAGTAIRKCVSSKLLLAQANTGIRLNEWT